MQKVRLLLLEEAKVFLMRKVEILRVRFNRCEGQLSSIGQESLMWVISLLLQKVSGKGSCFPWYQIRKSDWAPKTLHRKGGKISVD